jgi:hypothetical protein
MASMPSLFASALCHICWHSAADFGPLDDCAKDAAVMAQRPIAASVIGLNITFSPFLEHKFEPQAKSRGLAGQRGGLATVPRNGAFGTM